MRSTILALVGLMLVSSVAFAAPGLDVTKGPVNPDPSWTGPTWDPHATAGQWFKHADQQSYDVRPAEFHDNKYDPQSDPNNHWGGGTCPKGQQEWGSTYSIYGKVTSVTETYGKILGFDVLAKITNDTPALTDWYRGTTCIGGDYVGFNEWTTQQPAHPGQADDAITSPVVDTTPQNVGGLYLPKLTVEFAYPEWLFGQEYEPTVVISENEDEYGWFGPTPGHAATDGEFRVPTYDFFGGKADCDGANGGTPDVILPGETHTRTLHFSVLNGFLPGDPLGRYQVIMESLAAGEHEGDIFANRTTDLKIGSTASSRLRADDGTAYPLGFQTGGNVSVFYTIPEPGSLTALAFRLVTALGITRRRRK